METEEYKGIKNIKKLFESNDNTNLNNNEKDDVQLNFKDLKNKFEASSPSSSNSIKPHADVKLKTPPLNQSKLNPKPTSFSTSKPKSPTLLTGSDTNLIVTAKKTTPPQILSKPGVKSKPPPIPTKKPELDLLKQKSIVRTPSIRKSQSPKNEIEKTQEMENEYSFIKSQLKSPSFRKSPSPTGDENLLKLDSNGNSSNSSPLVKKSPGLKPAQRAVTLDEIQIPNKSSIKERFDINEEPPKLPQRRLESIQVEEPEQLDNLFTELKNPYSPSTSSSKPKPESPPILPPRGMTLPVQSTKPLALLQSPQPKLIDIWYNKIPQNNKVRYEKLFNELDTELEGFIWGPEARNIMIRSRLDCDSLANIWDLVDMNRDGQLDKKEFCIMIYLIDRRLQGYEIPSNL